MAVCRLNDIAVGTCPCHAGIPVVVTIISSATTVLTNNFGTARLNDIGMSSCGHVANIITSNPAVLIENLPVARAADIMIGQLGCPTAILITGSPTFF